MAISTDKSLRQKLMYQVFVRNFSREGTFSELRSHLDDIKALGTDIIWLMPIHPIGVSQRKGSLGSPYAISDYRSINPEFGTIDDFRGLVDDIHKKGMLCIIDVVYNHTSPDSVLSREHPEWFYHRPDGSFGNRVGDWSDIIDLDYSNKELWDYQIETLKYWATIVDGFRCDVAPMIPLEFWLKARKEVEAVRKGCIWLSESIEPQFINYLRSQRITALSDSEIYQAFDISYEYDCYGAMKSYLDGSGKLSDYADAINRQEYTFPENYVKLRFLENHDQTRARFLIPDKHDLKSWLAFLFFQKGLTLIYNGQEYGLSHLPSLFDRDTIDRSSPEAADLRDYISKLASIKKSNKLFADSSYSVNAPCPDILTALHERDGEKMLGVFPLRGTKQIVPVSFEDGVYKNLISGNMVEVFRGMISCCGEPLIIHKSAVGEAEV